jgi:hypothetical protein
MMCVPMAARPRCREIASAPCCRRDLDDAERAVELHGDRIDARGTGDISSPIGTTVRRPRAHGTDVSVEIRKTVRGCAR